MTLPKIRIDLDRPAAERWEPLERHRSAIEAMVGAYLRDFGDPQPILPLVAIYRDMVCAPENVVEMRAVAELAGLPELEVSLANLYYDAMKHAFGGSFGCTAFGVDLPDGTVLHARNLDWHSPGQVLEKHTALVELTRGGETVARTVGWPGFVGAFSGVAPGRFAVTLNAVLSDDPPGNHGPMTFLLRDVLETAESFDEAVERLASTPVASDSLLLVTGTKPGEAVVIERTPERHALRRDPPVVTNDYRALADGSASGVLGATACERFDTASRRLGSVRTAENAFRILGKVRMAITVQQMVFHPASGDVWLAGERV